MERQPGVTPTVPLTDGTLLLRLPDERDIAVVHGYGQDSDLEETGWLPIPVPCPWDVATRAVQEFQQRWHGRYGLTLILTMPPDTELRGVLHLSLHAAGIGEIAYGVAPRFRRQGLATRAVTLIAAWAFRELGLTRLEIVVTARGIHELASRRVAEKAGFVSAGIRRSHLQATGRDYEDPLYILQAPDSRA